ncbi:MAG: hypothetical protein NC390_01640 [Fusobacterium sp.]|nr:hypothetical protein [Fusobacterium sp.]
MNEQNINDYLTRDSSTAVTQNGVGLPAGNATEMQDSARVEQLAENDLKVIRSLMGMGVVTREQGQNLMKQVIQNAYNSITQQHEVQQPAPVAQSVPAPDAFAEFNLSNPDFFKRAGREDVLAYLKNSNAKFDKDELLQISKLVESLENNAVDRYLKKVEYGKTLNDENAIAKQRLTANAQNSNAADNNMVFTRAQIGKMSGDEFTRYESAIMDQLRKGLIK